MNTLKQIFLIVMGSLLMNINYAQCPNDETEITIQFIEDGFYPDKLSWDYKIQGVLSESGPYTVTDIITTCVPLGDLTIVGCDIAAWNDAIFEVSLSNDTILNTCPIRNGCYLYTSSMEDANKVPNCYGNPTFEVAKINIGTCEETPVIISGCTNPLAINYSECAILDNGSCKIPTENNDCADAQLVTISNNLECETNINILKNFKYNNLSLPPICSEFASVDAFYEFVVPQNGSVKVSSSYEIGLSLYNICDEKPLYCVNKTFSRVFENLLPGDTILLQIFSEYKEIYEMSVCIEVAIPSTNNTCANAKLVNLLEDDSCNENNISFINNYNGVDQITDCGSNIYGDAFYKFIVPQSGQVQLKVLTPIPSLGFTLYQNCSGNSIACTNDFDIIFKQLVPNDTLLLQAYSDFPVNIRFCLTDASPTLNDNCSNAKFIEVATVNDYSINPDTIFFKFNSLNLNPICGSGGQDAFYQFIVPSTGKVSISSNHNGGMSLFKSCDQNPIFCEPNSYGNTQIDSLTSGDTLILQIFDNYSYGNILFYIEEAASSLNNNCSDAQKIEVVPQGECESNYIELNLNFNSAEKNPSCNRGIFADAFYQFVVPNSGKIRYYTSNYFSGFALYKSCNDSLIICNEYVNDEIIENLVPGENLILQIFSWEESANITFCIEEVAPSENNTCIKPQAISVAENGNCEMNQIQLTNLNYNTINIQPECEPFKFYDVFYKFLVPQSGNVLFSFDDHTGFSIYDTCNDIPIFCNAFTQSEIIRNLPPGDSLILQIFETSYNLSELNFCLADAAPSINNNCVNALPITVAEYSNCETHQVDLSYFGYNSANIQPNCGRYDEIDFDAFYKFLVPSSGQISISSEYNIGVSLYNACYNSSLFCSYLNYNNYDQVIRKLPPGDTLILQIFGNYSADQISFCLEDVPPSINNNCVDALPITVGENGTCEMNRVKLSNLGNNSSNILPDCRAYIESDVFYKFKVPQSSQVLYSSDVAADIAIYNTCNSNTLYCELGVENEVITNLPAGDTLMLQIFDTSDQLELNFCLEESLPSLNNLCVNAEPFVINSLCEGNYISVTNFSNNVDINPYCEANVLADAFYSFIVPLSGHVGISTSIPVGISIYDDCLNASYYCNDNLSDEVVYGLNPGDTLVLQAFQTQNPSEFELCLKDAPPSSNNDCANAEFLQVYQQGECEENTVNLPINNNSIDINPKCNSINADIFYKITIPASGQIRVSGNYSGLGFAIYASCDSTSLHCQYDMGYNNLVKGLPANKEVLIQFFQDGDPRDLPVCIEDAPASENSLCENAIPLDILAANSYDLKSHTINTLNNSADKFTSCSKVYYDVFYEIVVPQSGQIFFDFNTYNNGIALYRDCGSENIYCTGSIGDKITLTDLTPGEALILQLFNGEGSDNIEFYISEPAVNSTCDNATLLCEQNLSGSNLGAFEGFGNSNFFNPFFNSFNNAIWYSFVTDNSGKPVSIEVTKGTYTGNTFTNLHATILLDNCESPTSVVANISIFNEGEKDILTIENPIANQKYYLVIGNDYNGYCSFEINILEGMEMDCCQLDYSLNAWCYYLNPNDYFIDVTINDFGENPSGYRLTETGQQITSTVTTRVGPIPNGVHHITFEGLDRQDCIISETINFNCSECAEHLLHSNTQIKKNYDFNASKIIESDVQVMPSTKLKYAAGDSIILKQSFTVEKGATFSIDIDNCAE